MYLVEKDSHHLLSQPSITAHIYIYIYIVFLVKVLLLTLKCEVIEEESEPNLAGFFSSVVVCFIKLGFF